MTKKSAGNFLRYVSAFGHGSPGSFRQGLLVLLRVVFLTQTLGHHVGVGQDGEAVAFKHLSLKRSLNDSM